jgi:hypothetical protein
VHAPVVDEMLEVRELPLGESASRALVVRWTGGSHSEIRFYADEGVLLTEGDLVGRTAEQVRALLHMRDVQHLLDAEPMRLGETPFFDDHSG